MPVLFQLFQCSRFALSFSARYRHVALGLRGRAHRAVPAREYCQCHTGEAEEQSEQHTEVNEAAVAEPPSSRSREAAASEEAMADICGSAFAKATADRFRGGFLFHYWSLGLCERILEESRRCRPRFARGGCFGFKKPQDAGNSLLAVGPNLVKLFRCWSVNYLLRRQSAWRTNSVAVHKCVWPSKSYASFIAMGGRSALRKQFMRDRQPVRFARQLTDQMSAHRAHGSCIICSDAARGNLAR